MVGCPPKNMIVMSSKSYLDVTLEMVETAEKECETELELATLFAITENKAWLIEDEEYDFAEGTEEHQQAVDKTKLWFALADKLRKRIFGILQSEGVEIPITEQIMVLEPFMKRNGYIDGQGWWVKK